MTSFLYCLETATSEELTCSREICIRVLRYRASPASGTSYYHLDFFSCLLTLRGSIACRELLVLTLSRLFQHSLTVPAAKSSSPSPNPYDPKKHSAAMIKLISIRLSSASNASDIPGVMVPRLLYLIRHMPRDNLMICGSSTSPMLAHGILVILRTSGRTSAATRNAFLLRWTARVNHCCLVVRLE
jgi:hypothetical protein